MSTEPNEAREAAIAHFAGAIVAAINQAAPTGDLGSLLQDNAKALDLVEHAVRELLDHTDAVAVSLMGKR